MPVCDLGDDLGHLQSLRRETGEDRKVHLAAGYTLETSFKNSGIRHLSDVLPNLACFICLKFGGFPAGWLGLSFYKLCSMHTDCFTVDDLCVGPVCLGAQHMSNLW